MQKTVKERVVLLLKENNKTVNSIHSKIGIPQRTLNNQINGESSLSLDSILAISDYFKNISLQWILKGQGEMLIDSTPVLSEEEIKGAIPYYADLPVSARQAGLSQPSHDEKPTGYMLIPNVSAERIFPVIGCSMLPKIKAGDVIGINTVNAWDRVDPDKIYMVVTNEERMIKRLKIDNDDDSILWCLSDNYKEFKIYKSEIINIYHVVYHGEML